MNLKPWYSAYNSENTVVAITAYPSKDSLYDGGIGGVASFSKNIISSLADHLKGKDYKIVVLCDKTDNKQIYKEGDVLIIRVFKRNCLTLYSDLFIELQKFSRAKNIVIDFEFSSFGDFWITSLFPVFLAFLRLSGRQVTFILHQIIFNLEQLNGHLGLRKQSFKTAFFTTLLRTYYFIIHLFSNRIVVLEEALKKRLLQIVETGEKITVISHGVDKQVAFINKYDARKQFGVKKNELIVLYFGYLAWYKGVDFLVKTFVENKIEVGGKPVRLVIAGGESPTQKTKAHYQKFIKKVYSLAKKSTQVTITGYVDEKDIHLYFSAADLVIFPYRTFMSSSGPLSLACSFNKPFIMSSALSDYFISSDFSSALSEIGLKEKDLLFPLNQRSLMQKIKSVLQKDKLTKLIKFSSRLSEKRNFSTLAPLYAQLITEKQANPGLLPLWLKLRYTLSLLF